MAPPPKPSPQRRRTGGLSWALTTAFLVVIAGLFVAFTVLLGKYELLILAYVLLVASWLRSFASPEQRKKLEKVAVVGEGMKIFNGLEAHYARHPPRSFVYYLLFPLTGLLGFFWDRERGRQELRAYWGLLQWILVLVAIGGMGSYYRIYQHFALHTALSWLAVELVAVYFLCHFFAIPLTTTALAISLEGHSKRLIATSSLTLLCLTGWTAAFAVGPSSFENLLSIQLMMDRRMDQLKQGKAPPPQPRHLAILKQEQDQPYFERLFRTTARFLEGQGKRIEEFNYQYLLSPQKKLRESFYEKLNEAYQQQLSPLALVGENEHIYLTFTQAPGDFWAMACLPYRESILYVFRYQGGALRAYRRWSDLPSGGQRELSKRWDTSGFVFSDKKRLAREISDRMSRQFRKWSFFFDRAAPSRKNASRRSRSRRLLPRPRSPQSLLKRERRPLPSQPSDARQLQIAFKAQLQQLQSEFRQMLPLLRAGRPPKAKALPALDAMGAFLEAWPVPWTVRRDPGYVHAARRAHTRWFAGPPAARLTPALRPVADAAPRGGRSSSLLARYRAHRKAYQRTRSIFHHTQMLRLRQQLQVRSISTAPRLRPKAVPRRPQPVASASQLQRLRSFVQRSQRFRRALAAQLAEDRRRRRHFAQYADRLVSFDYPRALKARLLHDHQGQGPALVETWWSRASGGLLGLFMWLFQLTMPLHIAAVAFCRFAIEAPSTPQPEAETDGHESDHEPSEDAGILSGLSGE